MPHSYHVLNHKQMYSSQPAANRKDHKLPENKFLFCNHANNVRLDPQIFDTWYFQVFHCVYINKGQRLLNVLIIAHCC